jgi:hypothetical protein
MRHFLYEFCGPDPAGCSYKQYLGDSFNAAVYRANVKYAFQKLLALDAAVYVDPVTGTYPKSVSEVDDLFGQEKIWIVSDAYYIILHYIIY